MGDSPRRNSSEDSIPMRPHVIRLATIALGSVATVVVLVRAISIPEDFFFAGRGVGIWISLVAAIGVIVAGLLQASEEL